MNRPSLSVPIDRLNGPLIVTSAAGTGAPLAVTTPVRVPPVAGCELNQADEVEPALAVLVVDVGGAATLGVVDVDGRLGEQAAGLLDLPDEGRVELHSAATAPATWGDAIEVPDIST